MNFTIMLPDGTDLATISNQELLDLNDELLDYFDGSAASYWDYENDYISYERNCYMIDSVRGEMANAVLESLDYYENYTCTTDL